MKRFSFCFFLILISTVSFGQPVKNESYIIRGYVYYSSSTTGLAYASVMVKDHKGYARMTDENGYFEIKLPSAYRKKGGHNNCLHRL